MTVTSSTSKSRYTGNGVTTAFTGSFRILDEDHVTVTHTSTVGVDTVKTKTTDYTVSGVGGASFTVTHLVAPASGVVVTLSRNVPATQELDLVENDAMPADDLETAFDKNVMLFQQAAEALSRAVRFPVSDSTSRTAELPVAALRAGKVIAFDADGDVIVSTEDLTDIEGSITAAAASAAAAAASAAAASTAETNAETAETAAEAAQAAAEAAQAAAEAAAVGSLLAANNLSDVASAATAFGNIKQAATEGASGVLEIATQAETTTGTDDTRAITPKKLTEFSPATATPDTGADSVLFFDATDSKIKKGTFPTSGPTNGTAVATTSGTAIQFTGIPPTVKRIIVSFAGVSLNSGSNLLLQIGPSGGVETSGYDSYTAVDVGGTNATVTSSAGHVVRNANAARAYTGQFFLTLLNASTNLWVISCIVYDNGTQNQMVGASQKTLAGTLERLRLTTVSGDTFDAGSMNIMYD